MPDLLPRKPRDPAAEAPAAQSPSTPAGETGKGYQFGTFKGVFTPSILTVLGVVMYLRFGWVLGNVGLPLTLLIVTLASAITFLTGLAIASIATNMRVGAGGAYYMISRSLGLEAGAAIGIPLFFAQALGIAFYTAGFAESIVALVPALPFQAVALATLAGLAFLAYRSADLALRSQFVIMALVVASLVSFFFGGPVEPAAAGAAPPARASFWLVFAIFFPAVTGIEAGIAMSGDLKNPARSLPLGTLGAVATGYAIYIAIPVFLSFQVRDAGLLMTDPLIMRQVAFWGDLILLGLWGASLSSAMGSLLGAPRTLQALARDGIVPRFLGKGSGPGDDPRVATVVACLLAGAGLLGGGLDFIAPVLSMFFLTSYGLLNAISGFETLIGSPSWRPTFRVAWGFGAAGALGCLAVMLMINAGATLVAVAVTGMVYFLTGRRRLRAHWGDIRYGVLMLAVQNLLYRLAAKRPDEHSWRPNILVLSGVPSTRWYLVELADAMAHDRGFLTVATVLPEEGITARRLAAVHDTVVDYLRKHRVPALVKVLAAQSPMRGAYRLVQNYGFGPLVPNTILLGETEREGSFSDFANLILMVHRRKHNMVVVRQRPLDPPAHAFRRIDVWWGRERQNAGFMLTLGYLLSTSQQWRGAQMFLNTVVANPAHEAKIRAELNAFIQNGRFDATPVVHLLDQADVFSTIRERSAGSGMVFLGIRPPDEQETPEDYAGYYRSLLASTEDLPPCALVLAAEDIEFHRIFQ